MIAAFRWVTAAAIAAAISLGGPPSIAAPDDPIAFAKTLYALPQLWMSIVTTPDGRNEYLTPALAGWVVDVDGNFVDYLEYDPLADSRSFRVSDASFALAGVDAFGTRVKVDFKNREGDHSVTLRLANSAGRWRLADIDFPDGRTLIKDLQLAVLCR
ncbi:MAG: hypothetical protein U1E56_04040 [Bauldia sp.]